MLADGLQMNGQATRGFWRVKFFFVLFPKSVDQLLGLGKVGTPDGNDETETGVLIGKFGTFSLRGSF